MWQDFADDYLDYVLSRVLPWGDSADPGKSMMQFDPWLRVTRRIDVHKGFPGTSHGWRRRWLAWR